MDKINTERSSIKYTAIRIGYKVEINRLIKVSKNLLEFIENALLGNGKKRIWILHNITKVTKGKKAVAWCKKERKMI